MGVRRECSGWHLDVQSDIMGLLEGWPNLKQQ